MPNLARGSGQKSTSKSDAQERVLSAIAAGKTVAEAMRLVQRSEETYKKWRESDLSFRQSVDAIRAQRTAAHGEDRPELPSFPDFCRDYLKQPLFPHQIRMWDVLEGREPRDMEACFRFDQTPLEYEPVNFPEAPAGRVIINVPPGHAKTTSISINWVVYQIHKNPNIKIVVVCKDQGLAMDILSAVKFRLTDEVFMDMHQKFAPEGGWRDPDNSWSATKIRVQGKDDGSHSPTFQALGIGGRIYGSRSDIILLDDSITLANVNDYVRQQRWLTQEVESRLDGGGLLALLGTRVAPTDLYSEVREMEDWEGRKVFTYFSMPALIDEGEGKMEDWKTLWPERFPARRLSQIRRADQSQWALVYQQQDVSENATFPHRAVEASINSQRFPGLMHAGVEGHRPEGMNGLYVIAGLDPAAAGNTAMVVAGLDRLTGKLFVLDGINRTNLHAEKLIQEVQRLTEQYSINEWVIEANAVQRFISQIPQIQDWLRGRGCKITPHQTNKNKRDPDFGVQAMAQLFLSCGEPAENAPAGAIWTKTPSKALIELPTPRQNAWVAELINQLVIWQPSEMTRGQKTDLVMALWFANIASQRLVGKKRRRQTHLNTPFLSPGAKKRQGVISLAALRREKQEREMEATAV